MRLLLTSIDDKQRTTIMIDNMDTALIAPCLTFVVSEELQNVGRKHTFS